MSNQPTLENTSERTPSPEKPSSVTIIESANKAYVGWNSAENERKEKLKLANAAGTSIAEFSEPIPEPEQAKYWGQLYNLKTEARQACDSAFIIGGIQPHLTIWSPNSWIV